MSDLGHCTPVMESHFNKVAGLKISKRDSNTGVFLVLVYFTTRVRHECYTNDMNATQVKNFGFDNNTCVNIFSHSYISYIANKRLQEKEKFHFKNYLLEMPRSDAIMRLKSAPQKLNFVMATGTSKPYTLDCSCNNTCTFVTAFFLTRTIRN